MKGIHVAVPSRCHYHFRPAVFFTKRHFVCADCKRLLQNGTKAPSQRRHASSSIRGAACDRRGLGPNDPVPRLNQYHGYAKHPAAVEHRSISNPEGVFLPTKQPSYAPPEREREIGSNVRQRLLQWRKASDESIAITRGDGPQTLGSLRLGSAQVSLPATNSLNQEDDVDDYDREEMEDQDMDTHGDESDNHVLSATLLDPGDMVGVVVPGASGTSESLCVFVRQVEGQSQFITCKGYWYITSDPRYTSSKIEKFVSLDDLAPVVSHLPATGVQKTKGQSLPTYISKVGNIPMDVAAPIVQRLVQLGDDINTFQRRHALAFDGLHETLADDEDLVEWKLEDLVPKVFGMQSSELSVAGLLALERFAASNEHGIYGTNLMIRLRGIWVQSRQDVRMQNQVIGWGRKYQESAAEAALGKDVKESLEKNPLSAFITKAHRLILRSRRIRSPTTIGILGPSAERDHTGAVTPVDSQETLTKNDELILRFIFNVSHMSPPLVRNEAHSICALIYRAIGAYPNLNLGRKVARLLLQELGVTAPWTDRARNSYHRRLPGLGIWPYQDRLVAAAEASCNDLSAFKDSVQHARKDWGQMPVYCIDDSDTREVDDGLSVERVPDTPDHAWVHVHIANPAAYISPEHPIAAAAKDIFYTTYSPSRKFHMMPPAFAQSLPSLAADRPVMTVSTLLQADGSVVDIKLSLGFVRNVIRLTHNAVKHVMDGEQREQAFMVIGGQGTARAEDEKASELVRHALPDLLLMRQFLDHRFWKRFSQWPEEERAKRDVAELRSSVWTSLSEEAVPLFPDRLQHWRGDPHIVVEGDRFPRVGGGPRNIQLVEHAMLLAGESAAKWCKDRNVPILFHVAIPHPAFPISKLNQLKDTDFRIEPSGRLSSAPDPHWVLKMWQYTKITSPIRRYTDLLNQWQIQAYLEAISGAPQDGDDEQSLDPLKKLPFTHQEVEDMVTPLSVTASFLKRVGSQAMEHWINQAFFRAFHFKEADLPEVWDFMVVGSGRRVFEVAGKTGIVGYLSPFRARAEVLRSEEGWEKDVQRYQYLPVKIDTVDAEQGLIMVKAVGPPSDTPTTTQPIHIQSFNRFVSSDKGGPEQQKL